MAQTGHFIPLTLTIIPTKTQKAVPPHLISPVPSFDYNVQGIAPIFDGVKTVNELEQRRLQKGREKSARYEAKVKEYKKLGTLNSEKEKIKGLLLICRPHLKTMNPIDLNSIIDQMLRLLP